MGRTKVQNLSEIQHWYEEGKTYGWMVEEYDRKYHLQVTQSMFASLRHRYGWEKRIHRDVDLIPWKVERHHEQQYPIVMLRAEARRRAGIELTDNVRRRLESWKRSLESHSLVVYYGGDVGFRYVERADGDTDLIRAPGLPPGRFVEIRSSKEIYAGIRQPNDGGE